MAKDLGGVTFVSHSEDVLNEMQGAVLRALERCGMQAEGYAKDLVQSPGKTGTGALKNSITHKVDTAEKSVAVGTNSGYAAFLEFGTGVYYPGGRSGWWVYVEGGGDGDKSSKSVKRYTYEEAKMAVAILRSKGLDAHMTQGQKAKPFINPAVSDHAQTYRNIIKDELSK